jgi:hypothetical protein
MNTALLSILETERMHCMLQNVSTNVSLSAHIYSTFAGGYKIYFLGSETAFQEIQRHTLCACTLPIVILFEETMFPGLPTFGKHG